LTNGNSFSGNRFLTGFNYIFARFVNLAEQITKSRMIKKLIPGLLIIGGMASCSTMKPLNFTSNKQVSNTSGTANLTAASGNKKTDVRFLDDIAVDADATPTPSRRSAGSERQSKSEAPVSDEKMLLRPYSLEKATDLQLKYAILLNTEVEELQNNQLLP
jgi:lipoprotein Spr